MGSFEVEEELSRFSLMEKEQNLVPWNKSK
jgi:hypothetical protein